MDHRVEDDKDIKIMNKISTFGQKSALGNFGVRGSMLLMGMFVQRQIICYAHTEALEQLYSTYQF